ncbi:dehydratase [Streptomyces corchorusii]|uniref:Dehydratase n=2 Tax=Streptomyces TaxID=1883 RepID=A0A101PVH8_STRCK|nr:aldo/keto reductase [Streptomyces corchorusii]KUN18436.1 dehydratase [Streptomyces corchorusii]
MDYRLLGRSGLAVSAFALGTMTFGDSTSQEEAFAQLDAFAAAGGTLIDTADVYMNGAAETIVGRWLAERPAHVTEPMIIATKGRFPTSGDPNGQGNSRRHLQRALDSSLARLGVEAVDLYQLHGWDPLTPVQETLAFLDDAVRAGKIRYSGLSNFTGWQLQKTSDLAETRDLARPVAFQLQYNLLVREVEWELVPAAESAGLGLLVFSPLAGGVLTGKYRPDAPAPAGTRLAHPMFGPIFGAKTRQQRTWEVASTLERVAQERGVTPAQAALAWVAARKGVSSVLLGARTLEQLQGNLAAGGLVLSPEETARLDKAGEPFIDYPYGPMAAALRTREVSGTAQFAAPPAPAA